MTLDSLRLVEHLHGHLGWLAAALLVHPAIALRRRERRAHLAVGLSAGFVTVASALGAWIYVGYRDHLRQAIFLEAPSFGLLMERKEHLAFAAVALAWAGTAAYVGSVRLEAKEATRALLRTIAFRAFACAAVLALVVAALGTAVAVHKSF